MDPGVGCRGMKANPTRHYGASMNAKLSDKWLSKSGLGPPPPYPLHGPLDPMLWNESLPYKVSMVQV